MTTKVRSSSSSSLPALSKLGDIESGVSCGGVRFIGQTTAFFPTQRNQHIFPCEDKPKKKLDGFRDVRLEKIRDRVPSRSSSVQP